MNSRYGYKNWVSKHAPRVEDGKKSLIVSIFQKVKEICEK